MDLVSLYKGVTSFMSAATEAGHEIFVVSHKTRHPLLGEKHDLHASARGFLVASGIIGPAGLISDDSTFFELTKEEKQSRAMRLGVDVFIDDLPEILAMPGWPEGLRRVLFDPDARCPDGMWRAQRFERYGAWADIHRALLDG